MYKRQVPKALKNGEIVDSYDSNRRQKRRTRQESLDPKMIGMVKKAKKKRKPGYKNKIKRALKRDAQQKRKIARRQERKNQRS